MTFVKVRQKGQVTLPLDVRDRLQLEVGNYLEVSVENDVIVLKPKIMMDRRRTAKGIRGRGSAPGAR